MITPPSDLPKNFFISYNKADLSWAEWIAWQLEEAGYTTVLQAWDFRPGSNFVLEMHDGTQAQRTVAVLSPDYLAALYTQPEWAAAFAQDPTGSRDTLLLIRVRECELTGLLSPIIYSDLVGLDASAAREKLLAGVRRERAKPTQPPAFPENSVRPATTQPRHDPGQERGEAHRHVHRLPIEPPLVGRVVTPLAQALPQRVIALARAQAEEDGDRVTRARLRQHHPVAPQS